MPSDALTLGFDTSAAHCAAALLCGDSLLADRHEDMTRGQAERLFPLIEEMLAEAGVGWRDLGLVGVGTGPGNFTGLRIAVSAARGLALSLGCPAIGVTRFEAQALDRPRPVLSAVSAPRDQVYLQRLEPDGPAEARLVSVNAARQEAEATGSRLIGGPFDPVDAHLAPAVARLAAARAAAGAAPAPVPLYVRPPDAAPARDTAPALLD